MSAYQEKNRGWKADFTLKGRRYTTKYFSTKREAMDAEAALREEIQHPNKPAPQTTTNTAFSVLLTEWLDFLKTHRSQSHFEESLYAAKRWAQKWGDVEVSSITRQMIEMVMEERLTVSRHAANKELRYLRALFNYGLKVELITKNPTDRIEKYPVEKRFKYVPPQKDIDKVFMAAKPEDRDYLWAVRDTLARVNEINSLTWDDVDFEDGTVTLYTRKKRGGNLTPRKVSMTNRLEKILRRMFDQKDAGQKWVFCHRYWDKSANSWTKGPYGTRHKLIRSLCRKAGVRPFSFHALRHAGASLLDSKGVAMGDIQRILGHENRTTTEIYLHSVGGTEREAIRLLEAGSGAGSQRVNHGSHSDSHSVTLKRTKERPRLKLVKG